LHGIDGRYASALYSAAAKKNVLPQVESELSKMKSLIEKDSRLAQFLESPIIQRSKKVEGVKSLLKQGAYSDVTKNLFTVMAENGRLDLTTKVINAFGSLMAAHRGEVLVTVTSTKVKPTAGSTKAEEKYLIIMFRLLTQRLWHKSRNPSKVARDWSRKAKSSTWSTRFFFCICTL
jgi:ATP synthase F1 delta subunit